MFEYYDIPKYPTGVLYMCIPIYITQYEFLFYILYFEKYVSNFGR